MHGMRSQGWFHGGLYHLVEGFVILPVYLQKISGARHSGRIRQGGGETEQSWIRNGSSGQGKPVSRGKFLGRLMNIYGLSRLSTQAAFFRLTG